MTVQERQKIAKEIFEECLNLLEKKGKDYSSTEDSLANFKRNAERLGLTKYQIWAVYFAKHVDSVLNSIKYSPNNPQVESEPIKSRVIDIINYAIILYALYSEDLKKEM